MRRARFKISLVKINGVGGIEGSDEVGMHIAAFFKL